MGLERHGASLDQPLYHTPRFVEQLDRQVIPSLNGLVGFAGETHTDQGDNCGILGFLERQGRGARHRNARRAHSVDYPRILS